MPKIRHINAPREEVKAKEVSIKGLEDLKIDTPDSVIPNGGMHEIMKDYFQGNFLGTKEGTFEIGASYMGGKPKITTITVKPIPAKLTGCEFTGVAEFVYKNELAEVLLTFDKPLSEGMSEPTFRTNANMMVASSITYDEDRRSGTFNVMGVNVGDGVVFAGLGGVSMQATLPVKDSPAVLTRVVVTPDKVIEGEQVEFRAIHDKKPDIKLVSVEADPSLQLVGELIVEGNDVVGVYKTTEFGTKTISVESYKISKVASVVVEKDMPKMTGLVVPASVLEGGDFEIKASFDKDKYLDVADFKLVIPDNSGITVVKELSVVGKEIKGTFKGTKEFDGVITATYNGKVFGDPQRLKVRGLARVRFVTMDPEMVKINGLSTGTIEFNKVFEDDQEPVAVNVNSYLELATPFQLNENKLGGIFKVKGIKPGTGKVDVVLAGDTSSKKVEVEELPPTLESVKLAKDTIRKGEVTHMSLTFNKAEKATSVKIEPPAFVKVDVANPVISDNVITYEVTGLEINEVGADITVTHTPKDMEPEVKNAAIKVTADAKVVEFRCDKLNPEIGEEVEVHFTADKKEVEGQAKPVFVVPEGMTVVTPFVMDENGTTGKVVVKCAQKGTFVYKVTYGAVEKQLTFNPVLPNVSVSKIDVDYENLEKGRKATVVATLDKAPFSLENITVNVNEFLTFNDDAQIVGNTVTFTVTGKAVGAGQITFNARANNMTKTVTVVEVPVMSGATAKLGKVLLNTPVEIECAFDKAPNADFVKVTPNVDEATVTMGNVSVEGNKAKFNVTILKAVPVELSVVYGSVTKVVNVEGVAGPTIKQVSISPDSVQTNADATLTVEFNDDGALDAALLHVTLPEGVTQKEAPSVSARNIVAKYTVTTEGAKTLGIEYLGVTKEATVTGTNSPAAQ